MNQQEWVAKWWADNAENTLRVNYPITSESIVFDVGAYDGQWSLDLIRATGITPRLYIFEPLKGMSDICRQRLPFARIMNIALSSCDGQGMIYDCSHESSMHKPGNCSIKLRDAAQFIQGEGLSQIDLMSINVEGHEYAILNRLLECDLIKHIKDLQIQFHDFVPQAQEMRDSIHEWLQKTHEERYCYPFVWESWRRK